MVYIVLYLGLMFFAIPGSDSTYPPNENDTSSTFCNHELCIETFATSFYTAMVVEHGFDVVAGIELSGIAAAMTEYNTVLEILQQQGLCSAEMVAFTASRPLAKIKNLPLPVYLEKTGHEVGTFLKNNGLLDCSSAIPLAFDYFKLVSKAFSGSDENKLGSYMHAVVQGLVDFIREHGLGLENSAKSLADLFDKEFTSSKQDACPKSN